MKVQRYFSPQVKFEVVRRYLSGEGATALGREFSIRPTLVHQWKVAYLRKGAAGLRGVGRPSRELLAALSVERPPEDDLADPLVVAEQRIAALERKLAQQALALDFFRDALPHLERPRRGSDLPGGVTSTPSSTGARRGKAKV